MGLRLAGTSIGMSLVQIFPRVRGVQRRITMKALIAIIVGASFLMLGGCNTVEGAGKDVKAAGTKVEGEAKEHKKY